MTIFLQEPEYLLGCLGFMMPRPLRHAIISLGAFFSALAAVLAPAFLLLHYSTPSLIGQMILLMICAWIFMFGLFRLFVTFMMSIFDKIIELFTDAIPGLATPLHYVYLGYWIIFEIFLVLGFLSMLVSALLLPFGFVQPLS